MIWILDWTVIGHLCIGCVYPSNIHFLVRNQKSPFSSMFFCSIISVSVLEALVNFSTSHIKRFLFCCLTFLGLHQWPVRRGRGHWGTARGPVLGPGRGLPRDPSLCIHEQPSRFQQAEAHGACGPEGTAASRFSSLLPPPSCLCFPTLLLDDIIEWFIYFIFQRIICHSLSLSWNAAFIFSNHFPPGYFLYFPQLFESQA
mgnify:CR=1 FL=1